MSERSPELDQALARLRGRAERAEVWAAEYRRCNRKEAAERSQYAADLRLAIEAAEASA